jgi:hypothetical protein
MFSFNTSKAKSNKFKSTRTCFFCGGTGFRHNGYKAYECMECKDGGMAVELDIDRLIEFLNGEIAQAEEFLKDDDIKLDDTLRRWANGKIESYEYLLGVIYSNSLTT